MARFFMFGPKLAMAIFASEKEMIISKSDKKDINLQCWSEPRWSLMENEKPGSEASAFQYFE